MNQTEKTDMTSGPSGGIFISMNSSEGFVSYFHEYLSPLSRVYILKGGPGTGKSSFLKYFGEKAEKTGHKVTYVLCSSDPDSLDGVIDETLLVGIFDGTSPHVLEPEFPGVRDEIINLGEFWNSEMLEKKKDKILSLCSEKSRAYRRAMEKLSFAGGMLLGEISEISKHFDKEAAIRAARMKIKKFGNGNEGKSKNSHYSASAFSMKGRIIPENQIGYKKILVTGHGGSELLFMEIMKKALDEKHIGYRLSPHPLAPAFPDEITIDDEKTVIGIYQSGRSRTDSAEFIGELSEDEKNELISLSGRRELFTVQALDSLGMMRDCHFSLEKIYSQAMDFGKKEACQESFAKKILGL